MIYDVETQNCVLLTSTNMDEKHSALFPNTFIPYPQHIIYPGRALTVKILLTRAERSISFPFPAIVPFTAIQKPDAKHQLCHPASSIISPDHCHIRRPIHRITMTERWFVVARSDASPGWQIYLLKYLSS